MWSTVSIRSALPASDKQQRTDSPSATELTIPHTLWNAGR